MLARRHHFSALLARWPSFAKFITEVRDSDQKLRLMAVRHASCDGVILRIVGHPYRFADLMLEGRSCWGCWEGVSSVRSRGIDRKFACVFPS